MTLSIYKVKIENLEKVWNDYERNHSWLLLDESEEVKKSFYFTSDQLAITE